MKDYMKISEAAAKWGISTRRVNAFCLEGRIPGAVKFGNTWAIPAEAVKPERKRPGASL